MTYKKRGNIAGVLLIILLVLLSLTVLVYDPFITKEKKLDYGKLYTESRSGIERTYFEEYQVAMRQGLHLYGGSWYFNAGYNVSESEIMMKIIENLKESLQEREYSDGDINITISGLTNNLNATLSDEGIEINITEAYIKIDSKDETRTVSFEDTFFISSNLKELIERFNIWLECDAGNLTNNFKDFYKETPCKFSDCKCDNVPKDDVLAKFEEKAQQYGINEENISEIVTKSLNLLNKIIATGDRCEDAQLYEDDFDYECIIDMPKSYIEIEHFYDLVINGTTDCDKTNNNAELELTPDNSPNNQEELYLWNLTRDGEELISFSNKNSSKILHEHYSKLNTSSILNNKYEFISGSNNFLHAIALKNAAAGILKVSCKSSQSKGYDNINFEIRFKHFQDCEVPEVSYGSSDLECSPGEGDGAGPDCNQCEKAVGDDCIPDNDIPCEFEGNKCMEGTCLNSECIALQPKENGTSCKSQSDYVYDCKAKECWGGECIFAFEDDGVPCDEDNECSDAMCAEGECIKEAVQEGEPCNGGYAGECKTWQCNNAACRLVNDPGTSCGKNDCTGTCDNSGICSSSGQECSTNYNGCEVTGQCSNSGRTCDYYGNEDCCSGVLCNTPCCNNICCAAGLICCGGDECLNPAACNFG